MDYPPSVKDPFVNRFCFVVQNMRDEITNLLRSVIHQAGDKRLRQSNIVSIMILYRIKESMNSIMLLITKGFERDAAVLLLTVIELSLDLKYISLDHLRAKEWIRHNVQHKKPWSVGKLFEELFVNEKERQAAKNIYTNFSMVKHGNPLGGTASFPLGLDDGWLTVRQDHPSDNVLATYLFCLGTECYEAVKAAVKDFSESGFDTSKSEVAIEKLDTELQAINRKHVKYMVLEYFEKIKARTKSLVFEDETPNRDDTERTDKEDSAD